MSLLYCAILESEASLNAQTIQIGQKKANIYLYTLYSIC